MEIEVLIMPCSIWTQFQENLRLVFAKGMQLIFAKAKFQNSYFFRLFFFIVVSPTNLKAFQIQRYTGQTETPIRRTNRFVVSMDLCAKKKAISYLINHAIT